LSIIPNIIKLYKTLSRQIQRFLACAFRLREGRDKEGGGLRVGGGIKRRSRGDDFWLPLFSVSTIKFCASDSRLAVIRANQIQRGQGKKMKGRGREKRRGG
jgi:hypothetical protein